MAFAEDQNNLTESLEQLWLDMWDPPFVAGQSGILVKEELEGSHGILVTDTESPDVVVAEGKFKPHALWKLSIFNPSAQELEAGGLHRVDYNLVAGELSNGNGDSVMLTGLIVLVSVVDEDNKIINSISLAPMKLS